MSGERQWVLTRGFSAFSVGASGSRVRTGERVRVVEASRLTAVEAERDAYRFELAEIRDQDPVENALDPQWSARLAAAVLARFPKNETEQG